MTSILKRITQDCIRVSWSGLIRTFFGPTIENAPDWKSIGGTIFAPNHTSYLDPVVFQSAVPFPIRFMMTESIYELRALKWMFKLWDTIPVPDGEAPKVGAIKDALRVVRGGQPLVIFPEGGIARDGKLQRGHPGVAALMSRARVPVIPVAILGAHALLPFHANFPRAVRVTVRFGDPIPAPDGELDRDGQRAYAALIMDAIHALGAPR